MDTVLGGKGLGCHRCT